LTLDSNSTKFNEMFMKNIFIEILKEKEETFPENTLAQMCEILAKAYLSEFEDGTRPMTITRHLGGVEKWLMKRIECLSS